MKSTWIRIGMVLSTLATANWAIAQDSAPPYPQQDQGGWRRLGGPSAGDAADPNQAPPPNYQGPPPGYSQQGPPPNYQPNYQQSGRPLPPQLTIQPGTFIMVRVNQVLSSEHNQPGDPFSATLVKPVVVDGFVVADRGQTLAGRVAEVHKAGHGERTSHLGIELTELTLIDGEQVPLHSQLIDRRTNTPVGRDVATIVTTTAVGAAIGGAASRLFAPFWLRNGPGRRGTLLGGGAPGWPRYLRPEREPHSFADMKLVRCGNDATK